MVETWPGVVTENTGEYMASKYILKVGYMDLVSILQCDTAQLKY